MDALSYDYNIPLNPQSRINKQKTCDSYVQYGLTELDIISAETPCRQRRRGPSEFDAPRLDHAAATARPKSSESCRRAGVAEGPLDSGNESHRRVLRSQTPVGRLAQWLWLQHRRPQDARARPSRRYAARRPRTPRHPARALIPRCLGSGLLSPRLAP